MKKIVGVVLAVVMVGAVAVGCGKDKERIAYRPTAFGENGQCYYVVNPAEVDELRRAGLCDPAWAPAVVPTYWHQRYYPYYASPAYYDTYVPAGSRTVYVRSEKQWGERNKAAIATEAKKATYLGSNGKQVSAEKIGATKYGAGNRFGPSGTKFGGGDRGKQVTTPPAPPKADSPAPPKADAPKPQPAKPPAVKSNPKPPSPKPPSRPSGGYGGGVRSGSGGRR